LANFRFQVALRFITHRDISYTFEGFERIANAASACEIILPN
jgi:hypothetical protein